MTNQPIEEKWKEEFNKKFCSKTSEPKYSVWNAAALAYPEEIKSFIENLLEQERKRLAKRIIKDDVTCPEAIMIFLDEQAELLDTHTENETKAHKPNNCTCPCHNI